MKYTKYNYKRRKNNGAWKFVASLLLGIIASCVVGLGVAWIVLKMLPINDLAQVGTEITDETKGAVGESGEEQVGEIPVQKENKLVNITFFNVDIFLKKIMQSKFMLKYLQMEEHL